jgi:hypothetical protein
MATEELMQEKVEKACVIILLFLFFAEFDSSTGGVERPSPLAPLSSLSPQKEVTRSSHGLKVM